MRLMNFLMEKFNIVFDGVWQPHEIAALLSAIIVAALILLCIFLLVRKIVRGVNPRKSTIFSHRRNKYKSRIGKNNSKYM